MLSVVLDTGPLVGLFAHEDTYREESTRGFQELLELHIRVFVPLPVVFETHKWLLYNVGRTEAREALDRMQQSLEIVDIAADTLDDLVNVSQGISSWNGSLEDASVVLTAKGSLVPLGPTTTATSPHSKTSSCGIPLKRSPHTLGIVSAVNLLIGPPGSGKTTKLLTLRGRRRRGERVWWVGLPSQRSYVYRRLAEHGAVLGLDSSPHSRSTTVYSRTP